MRTIFSTMGSHWFALQWSLRKTITEYIGVTEQTCWLGSRILWWAEFLTCSWKDSWTILSALELIPGPLATTLPTSSGCCCCCLEPTPVKAFTAAAGCSCCKRLPPAAAGGFEDEEDESCGWDWVMGRRRFWKLTSGLATYSITFWWLHVKWIID